MYSTPTNQKTIGADECGYTLRVTDGPPMDAVETWFGIWIYFWSLQVSVQRPGGAYSGGGHFGLQWGHQDGLHGLINFGMYDNVTGVPDCVNRGSIPTDPLFDGSDDSYHFAWNYNDIIKFRMFKSPKQNWTAAELSPGLNQSPEYTGTDQVFGGPLGDETAFRCILKVNDQPWRFFRDVLMKDAAPVQPIVGPVLWTERILSTDPLGDPPVWLPTDWPETPTGGFRDVIWDGRGPAGDTYSVHYSFGGAGTSNVSLISDSYGQWVQWAGGQTRTNPEGALLVTDSTFYDAPRPNVTPNPGLDPAARVATPRPWY